LRASDTTESDDIVDHENCFFSSDEVHTLLASTYRQQRILLNTLRYMANELRILLIAPAPQTPKSHLLLMNSSPIGLKLTISHYGRTMKRS
jgi:Bacterial TniB protein